VAVRVVIVDDQAVFRRAAEVVIDAAAGFELVGEAASGEGGLAVVERLRPDLVLVDVRMPKMNGVETARRLAVSRPEAVVALITVQDPSEIFGAAECGAVRVVAKRDFRPALLRELWSAYGEGGEVSAGASRASRP
jgi:DNA-binding NarL/FixJ family response regulator